MNERERFQRTMRFEEVDRPPRLEVGGMLAVTLEEWHKQGLPEDVYWEDYVGLDRSEVCRVNRGLCPAFETETLEETEEYKIVRDGNGVISRRFRHEKAPRHMPQWLRFPVETREDWEKLRKMRLNPHSPARYPQNWDVLVRGWKDRRHILWTYGGSLFGVLRDWMGFERILTTFYDDPAWIHEMMEYLTDFYIAAMHRMVHEVELDYVYVYEDVSYKAGPMISPGMFREFMVPRYRRFTSFLKEHGVNWIFADSDGNASQLIPLWLEGGFTGFLPIEVAAGMDPRVLRRQYGRNLRLAGGLDKRSLLEGPEAIDRELEAKVPALVAQGGYIPSLDHAVHYDISLEAYQYYRRRLDELTGCGQG